jgi:hypothetical protein
MVIPWHVAGIALASAGWRWQPAGSEFSDSFSFGLPFPDGEDECRHRLLIGVNRQMKALRQKGLEHKLQGLRRRIERGTGNHIEAVHLEPTRPSPHLVGCDAVGGSD